MNNKPQVMLQCIANQHLYSHTLLTKLTSQLTPAFLQSKINLEHQAPYWKYPDAQNLIFSLTNPIKVTVHDLLAIFPLSWSYTVEDQPLTEESAVWNQLNHPTEQFILPEVSWVHIYTWSK